MSASSAHLAALLPDFSILEATYKTVSGHPIETQVWLPKLGAEQRAQPRPVAIYFHGGSLISGSRLSYEWLPVWQIELMRERGAIMINADYRLLPEANGRDILADIADLLRWLPAHLPALAAQEGLSADLGKTLVMGGSAGGWLAMQTALRTGTGTFGFPGPADAFKVAAVITQYGSLNNAHVPTKPMHYFGSPEVPADHIAKHLAAVAAGDKPAVVSGALMPARVDLMACSLRHRLGFGLLGGDAEVTPIDVLRIAKASGQAALPPTWAFHGVDDGVLDCDVLRTFAARVKEVYGADAPLKETYIPGDHGVGNDLHMEADWVKEGLDWIKTYWP